MNTEILRFCVPGNPWRGAINRRDRAATTANGRPYNRKTKGFAAYQADVALCCRQAVLAARLRFGRDEVEVWITLGVPDRRRRDLDGPIKAILDGCTDGKAWVDDSQVWDLHVRKRLGRTGATVTIRRACVDRVNTTC